TPCRAVPWPRRWLPAPTATSSESISRRPVGSSRIASALGAAHGALHRAIGWPSSLEDLFQPGDEDRVELEEAVNGALQLLAAHRIDVELDLLGLGEERGILERVRECLAQELHAIPGRPRGHDEGAGD